MIFNLIFRELYLFSFLDLGAPLENSNQARSETFKNQQNVDQGVGTGKLQVDMNHNLPLLVLNQL